MRDDLIHWGARAFAAALLLTAIELAFLVATVPLLTSDAVGLVALVHLVLAVHALAILPLALLGLLLERAKVLPELPDTAAIGTGLAVILVLQVPVHLLYGLAVDYPEFPGRMTVIVQVALLVLIALTLLLAKYVLYPLLRRGLEKAPRIDAPRKVTAVVLLLAGLLAFALIYTGLGPLMLDRLCAAASIGAAVCVLAALSLLVTHIPKAQARAICGALLAAFVLSPLSCRQRHASFVLHNHALAGGPVFGLARGLADFDGDGAQPSWLGGADCAEGDAGRGPAVREIPGDGVDQDCRGGDAEPSSAPAKNSLDWSCRAPTPKSMSVLLITMDAVRADALSAELTPHLARFADGAMTYARAYSGSTSTIESLTTLFAGRSLSDLTIEAGRIGVPAKLLPHRLADAGYRAVAIDNLGLPDALRGGFAEISPWWRDSSPRTGKELFESAATSRGVLTQLARRGEQPLFAWAHFADAHAPYLPLDYRGGDASPYEREVAYVDFHVGRLLEGLDKLGLVGRTVVIVTADHGEELGAHGVEGHGPMLYESSVHVPLIVRVPGCPPARVETPVSLTQIAPALETLAGLEAKPPLLVADEQPFAVTEAWSASGVVRTLVSARHKLIVDVQNGGRVLFDLEADPEQARDIYGVSVEAAASMETLYQRWLDR